MRIIIQRVSEACVRVKDVIVGEIGLGLLVLCGFEDADESGDDLAWMARKIVALRVFADENGVMNRSVGDVGGELLIVSQFTLFARTVKGARPSFLRSAKGPIAEPLYERFCALCEVELGKKAARGVFGADMQVSLVNDGPVTILMDSRGRE